MPGSFFDSWALWQKMTFVLACAIVVTLCLGYVKVLTNRRKLQKYTAIAAATKADAEKAATEFPLTHDAESQRNSGVPFGVRAIQSGIEVEGVWISRPSSLALASRTASETSLLSIEPKVLPITSSSSIPAALTSNTKDKRFSAASTSSVGSFERATEAERVPQKSHGHKKRAAPDAIRPTHGVLFAESTIRGRPTTIAVPKIDKRASRDHSKSSLNYLPSIQGSTEDLHAQIMSDSRINSGSEGRHSFVAPSPYLIPVRHQQRKAGVKSPKFPALPDLDFDGDLSLAGPVRFNDNYPPKYPSPSSRVASFAAKSVHGPSSLRGSYLAVPTTPTEDFEEYPNVSAPTTATPSLSHSDSPEPSSGDTTREVGLNALPTRGYYDPPTSNTNVFETNSWPLKPESTSPAERPASFNRKPAQVLRHVNSGFEIIKPGRRVTSNGYDDDSSPPEHGSEIELHTIRTAAGVPITIEKRAPRKLQKRQKEGQGSGYDGRLG